MSDRIAGKSAITQGGIMDKYWKPALTAGILVGIISAIPVVNFLNCCCLWIIAGIIWSAWMYKAEWGYLDIGPGAALGAITGAIAGLVAGFLNIIIWAIFGGWYRAMMMRMLANFNIPEQAMSQMHMTGYTVLSAISSIFTYAAVGAIVGLIMGAIWRRQNGDTQFREEESQNEEPPQIVE